MGDLLSKDLDLAISEGTLACVKRVHLSGAKLGPRHFLRAIAAGRVDVMAYLRLNDVAWSSYTTACAARGHLDCLEYAHTHGAPWHERTTGAAAEGPLSINSPGSLDCLTYAHEHGCSWHPATTAGAAHKGNLDCLEYAHEHGCPWSEQTTCEAANGHIECLTYAHEHGAPWASGTIACAVHGGWLDCLQYAYEHGADTKTLERGCVLVSLAANSDQAECLRFLIERGHKFSGLDEGVRRHRVTIADALAMRRAVQVIQRSWRAHRTAVRNHAVGVIEEAFIGWACRPGVGSWFLRAKASFLAHSL